MSIVLQSSAGGQITMQEPATACNFTQTLPAASGVTMVSGNIPAFSAHMTASTQSIPNTTFTKVNFDTEVFDTHSYYDTSTKRFTPLIAGYYQINATTCMATSGTSLSRMINSIFKNGSEYARLANIALSTNNGSPSATGGVVLYLNGTTDYVEIYVYQDTGGSLNFIGTNTVNSQWSGVLVRAA